MENLSDLSRRERQVLEAVYRLGRGAVSEIRAQLADPPTLTAVRTHLGILLGKGLVRSEEDGLRNLYSPTIPQEDIGRQTMSDVLATFFDNSVERAVLTFIDGPESKLDADQLDRLAAMIERARADGR